MPRTEINGEPAQAEDLLTPALVNYGHFTGMRVRDGAVRGLDLHLARLESANRELYGVSLNRDRVRAHIRHALGEQTIDTNVRVTIFPRDLDFPTSADPSVMVTVRPVAETSGTPQSLQSVTYQRPFAHIKHAGTFAQIHYGLLSERAGFDDALFVDDRGALSEGAIANIGFFTGDTIVWPDAPMLHGITMQLLDTALKAAGLTTQRRVVHLADLATFDTTFVTNSLGISAVGRVDALELPMTAEHMKALNELYEAIPWDLI